VHAKSRLPFAAAALVIVSWSCGRRLAADEISVFSPDGKVAFQAATAESKLRFTVSLGNKPVLEASPMSMAVDGVELAAGARLGNAERYQIDETYPWRGVHSKAINRANGAKIPLADGKGATTCALEVRAFNDAVAFRFIVPGGAAERVPDESTTFVLPAESTVWYHDLGGHYEGIHVKKTVAEVPEGQWAAPPLTFQLPGGAGYGSITEAALTNYAGMALQADGRRGFVVRLGHKHPIGYPFKLRYGEEEGRRLAKAAAVSGTIATPWRVVMVGADLNALVNCDAVHDLCPPPDAAIFPKGMATDWIKPGRAVWKYLDGGPSTLAGAREFSKLAGELGFEHNIIEGHWSRWSDEELKGVVDDSRRLGVGIWVWIHSKSVRDPEASRAQFERLHRLGVAGVKIDFFDHEAKETVDQYERLCRQAAENKLMVDFHGANKPTGLSRTWPNEMTREAIKGMEASKLADRATHETTLPFTRMLAGHAEYTVVHFGDRRKNTTWTHQIASAAILSAPVLTYAAHPAKMLANPARDLIKSIPSAWDETIVLPGSEIGGTAVYARRSGDTWFLAVMNGPKPRTIPVSLSFLGEGEYDAMTVRDVKDEPAAVSVENTTAKRGDSVTLELGEGGGFLARYTKSK
jgi:alpha-glucosidase